MNKNKNFELFFDTQSKEKKFVINLIELISITIDFYWIKNEIVVN